MTNTELLGEWVNTSPYDDKGECSRCCYVSKKYYNFCPNCGVKIKKTYMTNREAIEELEMLKAESPTEVAKDALDLGIYALKQLAPVAKCGVYLRDEEND